MDTQRLILFFVFSFSAFLLWQRWDAEHRPPAPIPTAARQAAPGATSAELPAAPVSATPGLNAAPPAPGGAVPAKTGETITVATDLFRADIDTAGGVITQVALLAHHDIADEAKPYLVLQRTPERIFVAESGLLGEGMPNHRTVVRSPARSAHARAGRRPARVEAAGRSGQRRQGHRDADLPPRHLRDRRQLRDHQCRREPDCALRLFPARARHQDAGRAALDGAGGVHRSRDLQRSRQVQEGRIRRARQGSRRSGAQAALHQGGRQRLGRHGRALLRRRVAAARHAEAAPRVLCAQARRRHSMRLAWSCP